MIDLFLFSSQIYLRYLALFLYFLLAGRALILLISKFTSNKFSIPETILEMKSFVIYPIMGVIFTGNVLVFINFFLPLKSLIVKVILVLILLPNLFLIQKETKSVNKFNLNNFFTLY